MIQLGKKIVEDCGQFVQNCQQQPVVDYGLVARLELLEMTADGLKALNPTRAV